jgi:hypothetical protein
MLRFGILIGICDLVVLHCIRQGNTSLPGKELLVALRMLLLATVQEGKKDWAKGGVYCAGPARNRGFKGSYPKSY